MVLMLIKPLKHFSYINSVLSKFIKIKTNAYFSMAPFCISNISQDITWFNTRKQFVCKLFDLVWPFSGVGTQRVHSIKLFMTYIIFPTLTLPHTLLRSTSYSWWWFTKVYYLAENIFGDNCDKGNYSKE